MADINRSQKNFDPNILGGTYGTALKAACAQGNLSTVAYLICSGADVNIQAGEYGSAIFAAIASGDGHLEMVKLLLDRGADILAAADNKGVASLSLAAYRGHLEMVKFC